MSKGAEHELFAAVARQCAGHPLEHALSAAINLMVNAIREGVADRKDAEERIDELFGKAKTLLLDQHYDPVTGKRRNVFPFTQTMEVPFLPSESVIFHGQ